MNERRTLTRSAELSLALHRAALPYLRTDWVHARELIRSNLDMLKRQRRASYAEGWIREWELALERGPEAIEEVALTPGEHGDDLRQLTPFAGLLPFDLRLKIIREVRGHAAA